ncbi:MAG: hypothetical protein NZM35_10520 [Chitinophagales bacterium]|nr:hypothetical protein [Chitinophagales bacterium]MDW8419764.1 hypothetical protein [Chitinophagales bacterium]
MATSNLQENLKKYFYSGIGLAASTAEVVQKSVNELIRKGKMSESDGKKIVNEAFKKFEAQRPILEARYNDAVHKFVKLSTAEISKLQKRIEQLEKQLTIKKHGSPSAQKAAPKPAAKKKPVKKAAAKKETPSAPAAEQNPSA